MKTRLGLVSNSSSSSYIIFGTEIDNSDAENIVKKNHADKLQKYADLYYEGNLEEMLDDGEGISETLYDLGFVLPNNYDVCYLGLSWHTVKDNETGAEFKSRAREHVKEVMGEYLPCQTYAFVDSD